MVTGYSFKNRIFRAGFYVVSIGGLMLAFAGVLWLSWNYFLVERANYNSLSFLESVGLVSIAYVVYSAFRFSSVDECQLKAHEEQAAKAVNGEVYPQNFATSGTSSTTDLNQVQKEQLKREIERCCGKQTVNRSETSSVDAAAH